MDNELHELTYEWVHGSIKWFAGQKFRIREKNRHHYFPNYIHKDGYSKIFLQ